MSTTQSQHAACNSNWKTSVKVFQTKTKTSNVCIHGESGFHRALDIPGWRILLLVSSIALVHGSNLMFCFSNCRICRSTLFRSTQYLGSELLENPQDQHTLLMDNLLQSLRNVLRCFKHPKWCEPGFFVHEQHQFWEGAFKFEWRMAYGVHTWKPPCLWICSSDFKSDCLTFETFPIFPSRCSLAGSILGVCCSQEQRFFEGWILEPEKKRGIFCTCSIRDTSNSRSRVRFSRHNGVRAANTCDHTLWIGTNIRITVTNQLSLGVKSWCWKIFSGHVSNLSSIIYIIYPCIYAY